MDEPLGIELEQTIYALDSLTDANSGAKDSPLRTFAEAARRVWSLGCRQCLWRAACGNTDARGIGHRARQLDWSPSRCQNTHATRFSDRIVLHFQDGGRGDHDFSANGQIVTIGAPAYALAPAPQLSLQVTSVRAGNIVNFAASTEGTRVWVTNTIPLVTSVLSWPAGETDSLLEFTDNLWPRDIGAKSSPELFWLTVPATPAVVNGQSVVTKATLSPSVFYRLY